MADHLTEHDKITKIKKAVLSNFEVSPTQYEDFEKQHAFFRQLNSELVNFINPRPGDRILDVGCGTGASCVQMLEAVPGSTVCGLDNSPAMLEVARCRICEPLRLTLVEGDASNLSDYFHVEFDVIVYSASIFLIPDYRRSLTQALALLAKGGVVGLSFMDGLYDRMGSNLLALADTKAKVGVSLRKPVKIEEFQDFFAGLFPEHWTTNHDLRLPGEVLKAFYSVPAMSAGLFPGLDFDERVRRVNMLFDNMPEGEALFRWILMKGKKTS